MYKHQWMPILERNLIGDSRVQYDETRQAIIDQVGYDEFRDWQCELFAKLFSAEAWRNSEATKPPRPKCALPVLKGEN